MSLYYTQKVMYELNRDPVLRQRFKEDRAGVIKDWDLTDDERTALIEGDLGLLYVLGVNGQLLMHLAAFDGVAWPDYLQKLRDGVAKHGPVRAGVYAMTTRQDEKVAGV